MPILGAGVLAVVAVETFFDLAEVSFGELAITTNVGRVSPNLHAV